MESLSKLFKAGLSFAGRHFNSKKRFAEEYHQALRRDMERKLFYVDKEFNCPIPRTYWIEISSICNLDCPFCPTATGVYYNDEKMMNLERYSNIFDKIKDYALYIYLHKHGEATLNKDLLKIIQLTSSYKSIYTLFSTNLNTITYNREKADALVGSGISEIIASIDGASEETYGRYRRGGTLARALSNLRALAEAKARLSSKTPKLHWQFLINSFNEHELDRAREMAAEHGADIYFLLMDVWGNESWLSSYHKDPAKMQALLAQNACPKNDSVVVAESQLEIRPDSKLPDYALAHIDNVKIHGHFPFWCANVFHTMSINTDGSVAPCTEIADSRFNLGNLLNTDIYELWNSERFKQSRRYIMHRHINGSLCESCVRGEKANGDLVQLRLKDSRVA